MSGGSYNYLFAKIGHLESMAERLAGLGYADDAARETWEIILSLRQFNTHSKTIIDRLSMVWKAVEWWDSLDSGEDGVQKALIQYRGGAASHPERDGVAG